MFKHLLITSLVLLISSSLVFALDDQGNPNDPNENERANACYEDGSMADKCDTDWEWECGWHLIQFEYGLTTRDEFPAWCISIIPPENVPDELETLAPTTPTVANCKVFDATRWIIFPGNYALNPVTLLIYSDNMCTNLVTPLTFNNNPVVYAGSVADATALCVAHGHTFLVQIFGTRIYVCNP